MVVKSVYYVLLIQGSYVGSGKAIGQVTAIDRDHDDKNSVYGQIKYEFVNQSSEYTCTYLSVFFFSVGLVNITSFLRRRFGLKFVEKLLRWSLPVVCRTTVTRNITSTEMENLK